MVKTLVQKFEEALRAPVPEEGLVSLRQDHPRDALPEPPTTDENPQHREDFNRLLNAATSGNKSSPEKS